MKFKNSIELNQSQKITINMQMQKSLEILQLSYSEMIEKINNELENNPLLEPESNKEKKNLYNISKIEKSPWNGSIPRAFSLPCNYIEKSVSYLTKQGKIH